MNARTPREGRPSVDEPAGEQSASPDLLAWSARYARRIVIAYLVYPPVAWYVSFWMFTAPPAVSYAVLLSSWALTALGLVAVYQADKRRGDPAPFGSVLIVLIPVVGPLWWLRHDSQTRDD